MESEALTAAKRAARAEARARVRTIPLPCWQEWGKAMTDLLVQTPEWQQADLVFCFVSLPTEPDTHPLLHRALQEGKRLCVPRMKGSGLMDAVLLPNGCSLESLLTPNRFGIPEPPESLPVLQNPTDFTTRSLAVLPCLAAGRDGTRLGKGGGYYDRFLAAFPGKTALLCAKSLLFPTLPTGPLDMPIPLTVTEQYSFRSGE